MKLFEFVYRELMKFSGVVFVNLLLLFILKMMFKREGVSKFVFKLIFISEVIKWEYKFKKFFVVFFLWYVEMVFLDGFWNSFIVIMFDVFKVRLLFWFLVVMFV